ncbi:MAG: hypothetical protein AB1782_01755 [Cyanobacteriota bacterium]
MEHISSELNFSLSFAVIMIGISIFFLIQIFIRLSDLLKSMNSLLELVEHELKPTLDEFQKILTHLSSISDKADKHVTQLSETIDQASVSTSSVVKKAQISLSGFFAGLSEALKRILADINK